MSRVFCLILLTLPLEGCAGSVYSRPLRYTPQNAWRPDRTDPPFTMNEDGTIVRGQDCVIGHYAEGRVTMPGGIVLTMGVDAIYIRGQATLFVRRNTVEERTQWGTETLTVEPDGSVVLSSDDGRRLLAGRFAPPYLGDRIRMAMLVASIAHFVTRTACPGEEHLDYL